MCVRLEEEKNRMTASKGAVKQQKHGYFKAKSQLQTALQEVEIERAKLRVSIVWALPIYKVYSC